MVVLNLESSLCIYVEAEALAAVSWDALSNVDSKVVLLDCVNDIDLFSAL